MSTNLIAHRSRVEVERLLVTALAIGLLALVLLSLTLGRFPISAGAVIRILLSTPPWSAVHAADDTAWVVVEVVRLPRVLIVTLCGMGLGISGAVMQGTFRNPLVGPEIIGVTSAASFGGALAILLGFSLGLTVAFAFGFGLLALALAFALGQGRRYDSMLSLILSGVIVSSVFSAALGLIEYLADPEHRLPQIVFWLLGSFAGASYHKLAVVAAATLIGGPALLGLRWRINLLSLGEGDAAGLGVGVPALRWTLVALVALLVAAQVSVSGGVTFVGLIVPHFARMLIGAEHSKLLPISMLIGGIYLLGMDDLARSVSDAEIPIGVLTDAVGAVIFAVLFWRYRSRGWRSD